MEERREDFAASALRACADSGEAAGDSTLYESEGEPVADMMSVEREVGDNWTSKTYQMEILGYQISPDPGLAEAGAARNNLGAIPDWFRPLLTQTTHAFGRCYSKHV
jgi:hypothetical protein